MSFLICVRAEESSLQLEAIDYLKHGGRSGKLSGLAASVLGIKPLITLKDGEIITLALAEAEKLLWLR